ncbi:hypothetical protein BaRGS_00029188 [Batillaria attramentaria]|uniref:Histidine N-acetyltransferase C-terminal domain-containing protein n=1 Tax=Batillaria attramentaria TaxID=370345 RepID=A0ABD0JY37_9CAEN
MARPGSRINSSTEASEEICVASLSDYQAVVDIDKHVCHGLDRLPGQFSSYVDGPGVQGYTYKKGGRTVGFVSALLMDGGLTLGTTAGRLAPDCRGSGMYGRFKRRLLEQYDSEHPETLHYTITVDNTNNKAETDTRLLAKFARVLEKATKVVKLDVEAVDMSRQKPPGTSIRELSPSDVHAMMTRDPEHLRHLFPEGRILLRPKWLPFRIMAENTELVSDHSNVFVASEEKVSSEQKDPLFPGELLTCGGYYRCKRGICYNLDMFGTGSTQQVRAHVEWHVTRLAGVAEDCNAFVYIVYPQDLTKSMDEVTAGAPFQESNIHYEKELVLETCLHSRDRKRSSTDIRHHACWRTTHPITAITETEGPATSTSL